MKWCFDLFLLALIVGASAVGPAQAQSIAAETPVTYHVQLVLGTNQEKPPQANYKAIGPKLSQQLSSVFHWKTYWEANRQDLVIKNGKKGKVRLSKDFEVEIEFTSPVPPATVREIRLFKNGVLACKSKREIGSKKMAILGSDSKDGNSWFVVVRRDEPQSP
jgi:hypothetical protein